MDKLDDITKEVPPTKFDTSEPTPVNINDIISQILSTLAYEQQEMFKLGEVKRGKRVLTSIDVIKEVLYKEIELLSLTRNTGDDKQERLIDGKTRKILQQQVDHVLSILEMSVNKQDTRYFIIGLLLRLLLEE
jgi:hypothetical protein